MTKNTPRDTHETRKPLFPRLETSKKLFFLEMKFFDKFFLRKKSLIAPKNPKADIFRLKCVKSEGVPFYRKKSLEKKPRVIFTIIGKLSSAQQDQKMINEVTL